MTDKLTDKLEEIRAQAGEQRGWLYPYQTLLLLRIAETAAATHDCHWMRVTGDTCEFCAVLNPVGEEE